MDPDFLRDFRRTLDESRARLTGLSDAEASRPPAPGKWSPKEVIGHLIDSAANNHARFVRAQVTDDLAPATLAYLMRDYVAHLIHHLKQIG